MANNPNWGITSDSATVRVSNSTVTNNGTGLQNYNSTGTLLSRLNNTVQGNTANKSGTIGSFAAD